MHSGWHLRSKKHWESANPKIPVHPAAILGVKSTGNPPNQKSQCIPRSSAEQKALGIRQNENPSASRAHLRSKKHWKSAKTKIPVHPALICGAKSTGNPPKRKSQCIPHSSAEQKALEIHRIENPSASRAHLRSKKHWESAKTKIPVHPALICGAKSTGNHSTLISRCFFPTS
ncbi:hypothetical protein SAMN02910292_00479 [Lachnospiraceae bacterium XBB2008]|nr:hypothetical protein SAMN02910292_00479 [Lachnospiraceae bacterium XBB2008]